MTRTYYRTNPETGAVEKSPVPFHVVDERPPVFTDRYMEGVSTVDGEDISSRKKRREYMERNQLADHGDFKGVWAKAKAAREGRSTGASQDAAIRAEVDRAWSKHR